MKSKSSKGWMKWVSFWFSAVAAAVGLTDWTVGRWGVGALGIGVAALNFYQFVKMFRAERDGEGAKQ